MTIYKVNAGLTDEPSLENPQKIKPVTSTVPFGKDLTVEMEPYSVVVIEIKAE